MRVDHDVPVRIGGTVRWLRAGQTIRVTFGRFGSQEARIYDPRPNRGRIRVRWE